MEADKDLARRKLVRAAMVAGFPPEFGEALAEFLGGPATMERMASYLIRVRPQSVEEAADEAVTLVEQRARWVEEMRSEEANAAYTRWVNRPDRPDDEEE